MDSYELLVCISDAERQYEAAKEQMNDAVKLRNAFAEALKVRLNGGDKMYKNLSGE